MKPLTLPVVHTNGTPAQRLLDGYVESAEKLREALKALEGSEPNGRDYYVTPGALKKAQDEQLSRCARVREVLQEVEALAEHVSDFVR